METIENNEKLIQRIKKLQALAERGVGGEKETAERMLQQLFKKNGINALEELESEEPEYTLFSYNGKHEKKLLRQCIYKVMTAAKEPTFYHSKGTRQKVGIYCTKAQKIEIELEFNFYRSIFYDELDTFIDVFVQAQDIFPPDAPKSSYDKYDSKTMKVVSMAETIKKRVRTAMIDTKDND